MKLISIVITLTSATTYQLFGNSILLSARIETIDYDLNTEDISLNGVSGLLTINAPFVADQKLAVIYKNYDS